MQGNRVRSAIKTKPFGLVVLALKLLHSSRFSIYEPSLHVAMHRFISPASSRPNSAEQPATAAASSRPSNAEQPAAASASSRPSSAGQHATHSHSKLLSIGDVQRWVAEKPIASCRSADAQHIRKAAAVLSRPTPRQGVCDL